MKVTKQYLVELHATSSSESQAYNHTRRSYLGTHVQGVRRDSEMDLSAVSSLSSLDSNPGGMLKHDCGCVHSTDDRQ